MSTDTLKKSIHNLIDQINDEELLEVYYDHLVGHIKQNDLFNTTEEDLKLRAVKSLQSVKEGRTKSIIEFQKEVDKWSQNI